MTNMKEKSIKQAFRREGPVTGREIIQSYVQVDCALSFGRYQQLYKAMDSFDAWDGETKRAYLTQFFDLYSLMGLNCQEMVRQFTSLKWHSVPRLIRAQFVDFLTRIALNHIHHIEPVLATACRHFVPITDPTKLMELQAEGEQAEVEKDGKASAIEDPLALQQQIYELAQGVVRLLMECYPLCFPTLIRQSRKCYPNVRATAAMQVGYLSNLLALTRQQPAVAAPLWGLIVEKMVQLDSSLSAIEAGQMSGASTTTSAEDIFQMETELGSTESLPATEIQQSGANTESISPLGDCSPATKMDLSMALLLQHAHGGMGGDMGGCVEELRREDFKSVLFTPPIRVKVEAGETDQLLQLLKSTLPAFDEHLLTAHDAHSTPYFWFYACSLAPELCNLMLDYLWEATLSVLPTSPNEWKKSHNAAAFLSGILARANYVSFEIACKWLKRMADWCCAYVEQAGIRHPPNNLANHHIATNNVNMGGWLQHGTFYSVVQALLFVFCYRYREFNTPSTDGENSRVEEVHTWGFGRIVHSRLEPLRYISQAVALCFANISRHMQLIYCHHIIGLCGRRQGVEMYFPFSFCHQLQICSRLLTPLMRRFSVEDEYCDGEILPPSKPLATTATKTQNGASNGDDYDFMMVDEEDGMQIDGKMIHTNKKPHYLFGSPIQDFSLSFSPPVSNPMFAATSQQGH